MAPLLVALGVSGLAGWGSDLAAWGEAFLVLTAVLGGWTLLARRTSGAATAGRVCLALAAVALAWVSGVGSVERLALGWGGFFVFHASVIGYYGWVLTNVLRSAAREEEVEESFLGAQLWFLTLALMAFVFQACLGVMVHHASFAEGATAVLAAFLPASLVLLAAMVVRLTGLPNPASRRVAWAIAGGALLAVGTGGARWSVAAWAAGSAEMALSGLDLATASQRLDTLRRSAEVLGSERLALREMRLRSRLLEAADRPEEALEALVAYLKRRIGPVAPGADAARRYLDAVAGGGKLDGLLTFEESATVHALLAERPEDEEALLRTATQSGRLGPLLDRYVWGGFPALASPDRLELALVRLALEDRTKDGMANYFLGLLCLRTDRKAEARRFLDHAAVRRPSDHNVRVLLDRCQETEGLPLHASLASATGRIGGQAAGGCCRFAREGRSVWLPLEVLGGVVELRLDLRPGRLARGAEVQVYVDDRTEASYAGRMAMAGGPVRVACTFDEPGWHRVRVECAAPLRPEGAAETADDEQGVVFGGIEVAPGAPPAKGR